MRQLADTLTQIEPGPLYAALRAADPTLSRESVLVLLAQIAFETGWKYCHCWNLGNVKWSPGCDRDWCTFACTEVVHGGIVIIRAGAPGSQFRAYETLEAGAADYLVELKQRFAPAWAAVISGDPRAFVQKLKEQHYFTADEKTYENAVAAIDAQLAKSIPAAPAGPALPPVAPFAAGAVAEALNSTDFHTPPALP